MKYTLSLLKGMVLGCMFATVILGAGRVEAARENDVWLERVGTYVQSIWSEGRNVLINGANKYLNFGTISGSSGYGFRDNGGTIECKDNGGAWSACQDGNDGGGGGGSISTSTTPTPGHLSYWTSTSALGSIATGTLTETVTGLQFDQTRGLIGGAAVLSLSSGYAIASTSDFTNWNNAFSFYTTPSTRITAGNHIDWTSNTLDVVVTGDWTGTVDGNNFGGGAIGAGQMLYGSAAGTLSELTLGASTTILTNNGTTPLWAAGPSLCVAITGSAELCDGTDATGGSGVLSTTTPWTAGNLAYVAGQGTIASVATGTLTETVSGLQFDQTRALVGGAAVLSLSAGYTIPTTTDITNWNTAYANNHSAVTLAGALDYLTLAGQVITRAAIDLATDITGVLGIAAGGLGGAFTDPNADQLMFWDDTAAKITGIATLVGATISGTTLTVDDVTCTDCLTTTEIADSYLLNNGDVGTGAYDFGGASTFEIPNGTAPTATGVGEIAHDTTGNQLIVDDYVVPLADQKIWSVTVASTSPRFIDAALLPVPTQLDGYTITRIQCHVTAGTSKVIAVEDASGNSSEDITCATTNTTDDGTLTNATYTASELSYIDFGATSGAVDYVSISVFGNWTRE